MHLSRLRSATALSHRAGHKEGTKKKNKLFIFSQCSNRLSNALRTPCGISTYLWLAELGLASTKHPVKPVGSLRNPKTLIGED